MKRLIEEHEVNSIYEGNKITGLLVSSLKNAADKGNAIITRRKDKQRFILCWQSIHERCFQIRKEERWLEVRRKIREEVERKKEAKIILCLYLREFSVSTKICYF